LTLVVRIFVTVYVADTVNGATVAVGLAGRIIRVAEFTLTTRIAGVLTVVVRIIAGLSPVAEILVIGTGIS
jgi:hypothetical protein